MGVQLRTSQVSVLKDTNNYYVIGRLATTEEVTNPVDDDYNSNIKFYVTPICQEAQCIEEVNDTTREIGGDKFIGFDTVIRNYLGSSRYISSRDKIAAIEELLKNKLILFRTKITINQEFNKKASGDYKHYLIYKNMSDVTIHDVGSGGLGQNYVRIPKINLRDRDFISKLQNKEYVEFGEYPNSLDAPLYVICNKYVYYFGNDAWNQHETKKTMWAYKGDMSKIKIWKISDIPDIIECSLSTQFIDEGVLDNLANGETVDYLNKVLEEAEPMVVGNINEVSSKEQQFIDGLCTYCINKGLAYNKQDIINLHISIKTNIITVISGMTGTGKSQLAWAYGKMLDASLENQNLIFIPITPAYMEPGDILGYYNPTVGMFVPADTGLVDFLVRAEKDSDRPYIIIFDEMNLSQVEHWFAPFLSLLEVDVEDRYLNIYSKNSRCINDEKYPYRIKIGNNIRIIGTINLDETVKEFSDRLLDRTNIIGLNKGRFIDLKGQSDENQRIAYEQFICSNIEEFNGWIKKGNAREVLTEEELMFFDELHDIIASSDVKKGISFRVLNSIAEYITNIPKQNSEEQMISREQALDMQIKQRIISKIKGSKKIVGQLLGEYLLDEDKIVDSRLLEFFNNERISGFGEFNATKDLIIQKSRELSLYGYTY